MPTKSRAKARYHVLSKPGEPWTFTPSKNCEGSSPSLIGPGTHSIRGHEEAIRVDRVGTVAGLFDGLEARLEALSAFPHPFIVVEADMDAIFTLDRPYSLLQDLAGLKLDYPFVQVMWAGAHGQRYVASLFARMMERASPPSV